MAELPSLRFRHGVLLEDIGAGVFTAEARMGFGLIRSLDDRQAKRAILHPSIYRGDLPPGLQDPSRGE